MGQGGAATGSAFRSTDTEKGAGFGALSLCAVEIAQAKRTATFLR